MSPEVPRDITPNELIRVLKKLEWFHARGNKHQNLFKHSEKLHFIIVPAHLTIKVGTLHGIIQALDLSVQEFIDLL